MNGVSGLVSGNGPPCITSIYDMFNPKKNAAISPESSASGSDSGTSMPDLFASRHAAVEESTIARDTCKTECNVETIGTFQSEHE